jgi:hypothetical protein
MDNMRCLAIGVSDAPPLDYLAGAVNGAKSFGKWALELGIRSEILTDERKPVGFDQVREAIERLLPRGQKISRLVVYFAGHGLARDAAEDLWLLSEWRRQLRAVAVGGLRRRLERYGIDQVTIIGDACRLLPDSPETADLVADPILDCGPYDQKVPLVDVFRASSPFRAAYMVSGPGGDRCIFSGVMEEALRGAHPDAFESDRDCITNFSLARYIEREVPIRAAQYRVELQPDIATGIRPPENIYLPNRPARPPKLRPWPPTVAVGKMSTAANGRGGQRGWSTRRQLPDIAESRYYPRNLELSPRTLDLESVSRSDRELWNQAVRRSRHREQTYVEAYRNEGERPTHFETDAGFSIANGTAESATLGRFAVAEPERSQTWWQVAPSAEGQPSYYWRDGRLSAPLPLLIKLTNRCWAGAAAMPGFVATFTVSDPGIVSLIYRPMYADAYVTQDTEVAVARLRAGALAGQGGDAFDLAAKLREGKEQDPVRGVLAAYLYDAQGDVESVRRTAYFLADAGIPIPFDLLLLGRLPATERMPGLLFAEIPATQERSPRSKEEEPRDWTYCKTNPRRAPVAGVFPWLRQGWALLDEDAPSPLVIDGILGLRKELLPYPFTTLSGSGGNHLRNLIKGL